MDFTLCLVTLIVVNALQVCAETSQLNTKRNRDSDSQGHKFVPTNKWQTVRDGQFISFGLHYRLNLQTGLKEAKLLDGKKVSDSRMTLIFPSRKKEHYDDQQKRYEEPNDLNSVPVEDVGEHSAFKSYESLKKEFQDLNLLIKSDAEILDELVARFISKKMDDDEQEIINILTDLEYLVHHYDNALEFARMEGITMVVYPCLNSSSVAVRSEAIRLLGSAIQSNPKLQIIALETGSISSLLRLLVHDSSALIRSRTIYALSCLIRRFPIAQLKMINAGGLSAFGELFQNKGQDDLKLQIKVITLLYDLVMEYKDADNALKVPNDGPNSDELVEKSRQYKMVNLPQHLTEAGWCKRLPRLLRISTSNTAYRDWWEDLTSVFADNFPVRPQHDVVEKIVEAMLALIDYCVDDFKADPGVQKIVRSLEEWYGELSAKEQLEKKSTTSNEASDYYFYYTSIFQQVRELSKRLKMTRDEL